MLQEPAEGPASAIFLLVIISSTTGQSADNGQAFGDTTDGVLHLIDGPSSFVISSDNRQALGHAAHGVLYLIKWSTTTTTGQTAHGVLHLIKRSSSAFLFLLGFLSLLGLLGFPSL